MSVANGEDMQQLVYWLSHDMGAPLRAVVQFSSLLSSDLENMLDEKEAYWLKLIHQNGLQAQAMIEAMLKYSKLTEVQHRTYFLLSDVVQAAIQALNKRILDLGAIIDYEESETALYGDPDQWKLFFGFLLQNSLLFQPADRTPHVRVNIEENKQQIIIRVEDNGIGVEENHWPVLTRPFKRLNDGDEYPGIGMGLSFCARIARLHGGYLAFANSSLDGLATNCFLDKSQVSRPE